MKIFQSVVKLVFALSCNWAAAQGDSVLDNRTIHVNKSEQKCDVKSELDWEKVEVREVKSKNKGISRNFLLAGEALVKVHGQIKSLKDLYETEFPETRKIAAKNKSCIVYVYVDVSNKKTKAGFQPPTPIVFGTEK